MNNLKDQFAQGLIQRLDTVPMGKSARKEMEQRIVEYFNQLPVVVENGQDQQALEEESK